VRLHELFTLYSLKIRAELLPQVRL
jgi:hypothetical protein